MMKLLIAACFAILPWTTGCIVPLCLVEGTLVSTPTGPIPIEDIRIGQQVTSISETGDEVTGRVVSTVTGNADAYLQIQLVSAAGELHALNVTGSHPLATGTGWKPARQLCSGELIQSREGDWRIRAINAVSRKVRVHDLTVEPHHTFLANGVLVHNKSFAAPPSRDAMLGVWIGQLDDSWNTLMRMELRPDGTGLMACKAGSHDPRLYEITEWTLDQWELNFKIRQIAPGGNTRVLTMHGKAKGWRSLQLDVRAQEHDTSWDQARVRMRREDDVERDLEALKKRMLSPESQPQP